MVIYICLVFQNTNLYTLNTTTGVATRVGSATRFGLNESQPQGMTSHNGSLYMLGGANDFLYTLDTTTGLATRVGSATQFSIREGGPTGLASVSIPYSLRDILEMATN